MRGSIILIAALLVAHACAALDEQTYRDRFTTWMQKHSKSYAAHEFQSRYAVFKDNLDYVERWNADKTHSHKLETNLFADLTNAEYQRIYLGTHIDGRARLAAAAKKGLAVTVPVGAPASVDWRLSGAVTPIKNQGQCGSCWSFSTTGATEGIHKMSTGNLVSLSEQNLMDCSSAEGNQGCNGGLMDNAFKYIISNKGIDTESSYPYQGVVGSCRYSVSNLGSTIDNYQDVSSGSESALQTAAAQQPVSVAIDASHPSFQLYSSGVYYEPACSTTSLDHGVLVIGYGTDSGADFWLVKNSWGTTWGLSGYIEMSRNRNNNCGIATTASYPTISGATSGTSASASGSSGGKNTTSSSGSGTGSGSGNSGSGNSGSGSQSSGSGSGNSGSGSGNSGHSGSGSGGNSGSGSQSSGSGSQSSGSGSQSSGSGSQSSGSGSQSSGSGSQSSGSGSQSSGSGSGNSGSGSGTSDSGSGTTNSGQTTYTSGMFSRETGFRAGGKGAAPLVKELRQFNDRTKAARGKAVRNVRRLDLNEQVEAFDL